MSRKYTSLIKVSQAAMVLIAALTITTISSGGQHWGLYVQGHTPAYVPHNPEHGFNETRWRRWPEAWPSDLTVNDAPKPVTTKPAPKTEKEEEDDQPPTPPSGADKSLESGMTPEIEQPRTDLQPIPPDDARPSPPPGLTRPETAEPSDAPTEALPEGAPAESPTEEAAPPATTDPPATTEEPTPELAPPKEETTEPVTPPAAVPSRTPGTPLPVPSTDLDTRPKLPRTSPPLKRRGTEPLQARTGAKPVRRPRTSEAVFRQESPTARITSRPEQSLDAQFEQLPSSLDALPEEPPATLSAPAVGEPELFQPGAGNRAPAQTARPSSVKPASYNAPHRIESPESRYVIRQESAPRAEVRQVKPAEAQASESRAPQVSQLVSQQRVNPLRDEAARDRLADGGPTRENPLRR